MSHYLSIRWWCRLLPMHLPHLTLLDEFLHLDVGRVDRSELLLRVCTYALQMRWDLIRIVRLTESSPRRLELGRGGRAGNPQDYVRVG